MRSSKPPSWLFLEVSKSQFCTKLFLNETLFDKETSWKFVQVKWNSIYDKLPKLYTKDNKFYGILTINGILLCSHRKLLIFDTTLDVKLSSKPEKWKPKKNVRKLKITSKSIFDSFTSLIFMSSMVKSDNQCNLQTKKILFRQKYQIL